VRDHPFLSLNILLDRAFAIMFALFMTLRASAITLAHFMTLDCAYPLSCLQSSDYWRTCSRFCTRPTILYALSRLQASSHITDPSQPLNHHSLHTIDPSQPLNHLSSHTTDPSQPLNYLSSHTTDPSQPLNYLSSHTTDSSQPLNHLHLLTDAQTN
jgi:hypothetical protein